MIPFTVGNICRGLLQKTRYWEPLFLSTATMHLTPRRLWSHELRPKDDCTHQSCCGEGTTENVSTVKQLAVGQEGTRLLKINRGGEGVGRDGVGRGTTVKQKGSEQMPNAEKKQRDE